MQFGMPAPHYIVNNYIGHNAIAHHVGRVGAARRKPSVARIDLKTEK
jgi:hypothetical protein